MTEASKTRDRSIPMAAEAMSRPVEPGRQSAKIWARGSVELRFYQPRGVDTQTPHDRDELYFVVAGRGSYHCEDIHTRFEPGDMLFAPAGAEHRFTDFSDDMAIWVVFYGPIDGEAAGGHHGTDG